MYRISLRARRLKKEARVKGVVVKGEGRRRRGVFLVENLRTSIPFDMAEYINRFLAVGFAWTITSKREQVSQAVGTRCRMGVTWRRQR